MEMISQEPRKEWIMIIQNLCDTKLLNINPICILTGGALKLILCGFCSNFILNMWPVKFL